MKPKYSQITRSLPIAVFIAASMPFVVPAGIVPDDPAGNAAPTAANNGANTIRADGGSNITNPLVTIISGVSMTGSVTPLETEVLEITAANYNVNNAGSLAGSNHSGINSTFAFTLSNSGTISGGGLAREGISTVGGLTSITNSGTISGTNDAIYFSSNGGTVINSGLLDGITGPLSDGIHGANGMSVTNNNGGLIRGNDNGIYGGTDLNLTNNWNATVTSLTNAAVDVTSGAIIANYGTISGATDGVAVTTSAYITNNYTMLVGPDAGGRITGTTGDGVAATTGLTLINQNLGSILGALNGISATDGAIITNAAGGTITGTTTRGITAGNAGIINNSGAISGGISGILLLNNGVVTNNAGGSITGGTNDGITAGDFASITNSGTISGGTHGIYLVDPTSSSITNNLGGLISGGFQGIGGNIGVETITNSGTITGTTNAMELGGGANIVTLGDGSVVNGNVRATGGSNAITMNGGLTSTGDSTQNIINGSVFDGLTLNKTGSGMAVVTGTTAANSISVTGGFLYLRNNVTNAAGGENTISANGSGIGGLGTWDSAITLINGASISGGTNPLALTNTVGNSVGTLTVTGDVTLDSTSDYVWNATPGGASDRINLTGAGNVFTTNNSDFVISPTNVNSPLHSGSTIVVDTAETLVGSFDSISVASFPSTTPDTGLFYANENNPIIAGYFSTLSKVNGSQDWQLTIDHDYSQFGSNPNEVAAGVMLNGLVNTAYGDVADLLAAMDYSDESVTEGVLAALDPGGYLATASGLANNNYHLHRTVEAHNAAVRAGGSVASVAPPSYSSAKGGVPAPMSSGCAGRSNVWGSFSYDWQELSTSNNSFDQDGESAAFTAGIDFTVAENFRLGLVAEGSQTDWDGDLYLGSEVDSYRFAAYANWGAATGWFVDALIGYNTHSVDQTRGTFMARAATESASYDADGWQGLINAGYTMQTSAGTFSPYIGLEWQQLSVDSFDGTGGPLPVSMSGYDIDSLRALAGVRWEADLSTTIKGYASVAYAFEFEDNAADTTVSFGGGSYRASGMEQGDAVLISAGIRWSLATCMTLDVGYRGEFAMDDGVDSNGANIGLNYSF